VVKIRCVDIFNPLERVENLAAGIFLSYCSDKKLR
jgi:hypothetical protein